MTKAPRRDGAARPRAGQEARCESAGSVARLQVDQGRRVRGPNQLPAEHLFGGTERVGDGAEFMHLAVGKARKLRQPDDDQLAGAPLLLGQARERGGAFAVGHEKFARLLDRIMALPDARIGGEHRGLAEMLAAIGKQLDRPDHQPLGLVGDEGRDFLRVAGGERREEGRGEFARDRRHGWSSGENQSARAMLRNPLRQVRRYLRQNTYSRLQAGVAVGGADFGGGRGLLRLELLEARAQAGVHNHGDRAATGGGRRRTGWAGYRGDNESCERGESDGANRGHGRSPKQAVIFVWLTSSRAPKAEGSKKRTGILAGNILPDYGRRPQARRSSAPSRPAPVHSLDVR